MITLTKFFVFTRPPGAMCGDRLSSEDPHSSRVQQFRETIKKSAIPCKFVVWRLSPSGKPDARARGLSSPEQFFVGHVLGTKANLGAREARHYMASEAYAY